MPAEHEANSEQNLVCSLECIVFFKLKVLGHIKITSLGTVATSGLDCVSDILYGGFIIENKMFHDVFNAAEHQMCLYKAWSTAVGISVFRRHVKLTCLGQSIGYFAAAV